MRRAFTLFEVLVAIGLIGVLAGALAIFVDDLATTGRVVARANERVRGCDALFAAVEGALQTAVADGGARGAGVSGTSTSLRVLSSRTEAAGGTARQISEHAFAPLAVTELRDSAGLVSLGRAGLSTVLPPSVARVRFRYHDGTGWTDAFDSLQAGALPRAVEVSVWFAAPDAAGGEAASDRSTRDDDAPDSEDGMEEELPPADRVRVFAVPDAAGEEAAP
jgi:prepilin-type N-terminal cleavage/methylation domain-containing protein